MSQAVAWAGLYTDLKDELNESAADEVTLLRISNRILNDMVLSLDLAETIRTAEVFYCGEPFVKYAEPTGMKSMGLIDLRPRDTSNFFPFRWLTPYRFNQLNSGEFITIAREDASEYFEIQHDQFNGLSTYLTACDTSITTDGAWTAGTGAANITQDNYDYKEGSGAVNFDVDGATATISFVPTTAKDISAYTAFQRVRFFMKLPTAPTSIAVRWGSDSSNYYSHAVTAQAHGKAFNTSDWNEIQANKDSATVTGTPVDTTIAYFALVITFAAPTTDTDFLIDCIKLIKPEVLLCEYYSVYAAESTAGADQEALTTTASTTDKISLQNESRIVFIDGVCWRYLRMRGDKQAKNDAMVYKADYETGKQTIRFRYPSRRRFPERERVLPRLAY